MKKAIIIYDSLFGNTKKVAMALSRGLEAGGIYVDSKFVSDCSPNELIDYDVIGIGSPTHFRGVSKNIKLFLSNLSNIGLNNKISFAFDTKADSPLVGSAAKKIVKSLKKMNLKVIDIDISGKVMKREGPLVESTLKTMEQLGICISDRFDHNSLKIYKERRE
jgi:flavodoxin